jgi:DNA-binding MarR family transcriptional regulator
VTVRKLHAGGLVDLVHGPGRIYVKASELGLRRLRLSRRFTHGSKAELEAELTGGERYQLTQLLARANDALQARSGREWWLAP